MQMRPHILCLRALHLIQASTNYVSVDGNCTISSALLLSSRRPASTVTNIVRNVFRCVIVNCRYAFLQAGNLKEVPGNAMSHRQQTQQTPSEVLGLRRPSLLRLLRPRAPRAPLLQQTHQCSLRLQGRSLRS